MSIPILPIDFLPPVTAQEHFPSVSSFPFLLLQPGRFFCMYLKCKARHLSKCTSQRMFTEKSLNGKQETT